MRRPLRSRVHVGCGRHAGYVAIDVTGVASVPSLMPDSHTLPLVFDSDAFLASIIHSSDDAIISKDLNGIITSWNQGAERLFGYSAEEAIGQPVTLVFPPGKTDEEPKILERIRRGEPIEHYQTVRRHKSGELIEISLSVSPIHDRNGRVVGAAKIARRVNETNSEMERFRVTLSSIGDAVIATVAGIG